MNGKILNSLRNEILCVVLLLGCALVVSAQDIGAFKVDLPVGVWTFAALPAESQETKVVVYSVTTKADKGLELTNVGIRNQSDKSTSWVKLAWKLYREKDGQSTELLGGETPYLAIMLAPNEYRKIDYSIVRFSDVIKSEIRGGTLAGDYRIRVFVTENEFASGLTSAERQKAKSGALKVASYKDDITPVKCKSTPASPNSVTGRSSAFVTDFVPAKFAPMQCQDQICMWNGQSKDGCFLCNGSPGFGCQVQSCQTCTNTRC